MGAAPALSGPLGVRAHSLEGASPSPVCSHRAERPSGAHAGPGGALGERRGQRAACAPGSGVKRKKYVCLTHSRLRCQTGLAAEVSRRALQSGLCWLTEHGTQRRTPAVHPARSAPFGEVCGWGQGCGQRVTAAAAATLGRRLTPAAAFLVASVFLSSQHPWEATDGGHWAAGGDRGGPSWGRGGAAAATHGGTDGTARGPQSPPPPRLQRGDTPGHWGPSPSPQNGRTASSRATGAGEARSPRWGLGAPRSAETASGWG